MDHGIKYVQPGLDYFYDKFGDDIKHTMLAFKAAGLLCPTLVTQILSTEADIDQLIIHLFLSATTIDHLKERLPTYLAKALALTSTALSPDVSIDSLEWQKNSIGPPFWSQAVQLVFLVQPSPAAAKNKISILNHIGDTQANTVKNYVESTIMLQYNKHKK